MNRRDRKKAVQVGRSRPPRRKGRNKRKAGRPDFSRCSVHARPKGAHRFYRLHESVRDAAQAHYDGLIRKNIDRVRRTPMYVRVLYMQTMRVFKAHVIPDEMLPTGSVEVWRDDDAENNG